jgi:hypothetical protein
MKIKLDRLRNDDIIDANKIEIELNTDVSILISMNKFGQLVINKQQYGDGASELIILPSVCNEIRIS